MRYDSKLNSNRKNTVISLAFIGVFALFLLGGLVYLVDNNININELITKSEKKYPEYKFEYSYLDLEEKLPAENGTQTVLPGKDIQPAKTRRIEPKVEVSQTPKQILAVEKLPTEPTLVKSVEQTPVQLSETNISTTKIDLTSLPIPVTTLAGLGTVETAKSKTISSTPQTVTVAPTIAATSVTTNKGESPAAPTVKPEQSVSNSSATQNETETVAIVSAPSVKQEIEPVVYPVVDATLTHFADFLTGESQFYQLYSNRDTVIIGKEGTLVFVPAYCFAKPNEEPVGNAYTLELKENFKKSDLTLAGKHIDLGMQTSGSKGLVYIMAYSDGTELVMKKSANLYIELPYTEKVLDTQSDFDFKKPLLVYTEGQKGNSDWKFNQYTEKTVISLTHELLPYSQMLDPNSFHRPIGRNHGKRLLKDLQTGKFNGSIVTTREFCARLHLLKSVESHLYDLASVYLKNAHLPLRHSDSLVVLKIGDIKKELAFQGVQDKNVLKVYDNLKSRFVYFRQQQLGRAVSETSFLTAGTKNANDRKEEPVNFNSGKLNTITNALKNRLAGNPWLALQSAYSAHIQTLGWFNLTQPLKLNASKNTSIGLNIKLKNDHPNPVDNNLVRLYINEIDLFIDTQHTGDGNYVVTQPLPKQIKKATIIAVSFSGTKVFMGKNEVNIEKPTTVELWAKATTRQKMEETLNSL